MTWATTSCPTRLGSGGAGIDGGLHGGDLAEELDGDQSGVGALGAEEPDVGGLGTGVGGLDGTRRGRAFQSIRGHPGTNLGQPASPKHPAGE